MGDSIGSSGGSMGIALQAALSSATEIATAGDADQAGPTADSVFSAIQSHLDGLGGKPLDGALGGKIMSALGQLEKSGHCRPGLMERTLELSTPTPRASVAADHGPLPTLPTDGRPVHAPGGQPAAVGTSLVSHLADLEAEPVVVSEHSTPEVAIPKHARPHMFIADGLPDWLGGVADIDGPTIGKQSLISKLLDLLTHIFSHSQTRLFDGIMEEDDVTSISDQICARVKDDPDVCFALTMVGSTDLTIALQDTLAQQFPGLNKRQVTTLADRLYSDMREARPTSVGKFDYDDRRPQTLTVKGRDYHYQSDLGADDRGAFGRVMLFRSEDGRQLVAKSPRMTLPPARRDKACGLAVKEVDMHRYAVGRDDITHTNVAGYEDVTVGPLGELIHIQEHVDGSSMGHLQRRMNDLHLDDAERLLVTQYLMAGVMDGMIHVSEQRSIMHLDLKPSNVMVDTETCTPKIVDFGLSEYEDPDGQYFDPKGTFDYMAPEVDAGQDYHRSADTWSLGAMVYSMLNGTAPQKDADQKVAGLDRGTEAGRLMGDMMHHDPEHRPPLSELRQRPFFTEPAGNKADAQALIRRLMSDE